MRMLAGLYRPVESQTPYGGRSVTFEAMGSAWLACGAPRRSERGEGDERHAVETMSAETRDDLRLETGQVLRFSGADWEIVIVRPLRPGRVGLELERRR
ncbi:MAG: phage head-tail adapter protein [Brevundimonas sp.]|nr:phage head-tail adapter protein [Brevundimonas sp.]